MERRRAIAELLREALRIGANVGEAIKEAEKELSRAVLGEVLKPLEEELVKSIYALKAQPQPTLEELKAEIARSLGLSESGDLFAELERAIRGCESASAERMRERPTEVVGESGDSR
ncbi:MAG: hypothetical protein QXS85_02770 [Acidilobaceae archaeon]